MVALHFLQAVEVDGDVLIAIGTDASANECHDAGIRAEAVITRDYCRERDFRKLIPDARIVGADCVLNDDRALCRLIACRVRGKPRHLLTAIDRKDFSRASDGPFYARKSRWC